MVGPPGVTGVNGEGERRPRAPAARGAGAGGPVPAPRPAPLAFPHPNPPLVHDASRRDEEGTKGSLPRPLPIPCGDGTRGAGNGREVLCSGGDGEDGTSRRWGGSGGAICLTPPAPSPVRRGGGEGGKTRNSGVLSPLGLPLSVQERGLGGEANRAPPFPYLSPPCRGLSERDGPGPPPPLPPVREGGVRPRRAPPVTPRDPAPPERDPDLTSNRFRHATLLPREREPLSRKTE
jgi:hypothetical protein